jgi:hypothetical protein
MWYKHNATGRHPNHVIFNFLQLEDETCEVKATTAALKSHLMY